MDESSKETEELVPVQTEFVEPPITIQDISQTPTSNVISVSSIFTLDDILTSVIKQKEAHDRNNLESIGKISSEELREKLISWAKIGFPNGYELRRVCIDPPTKCVDGVSRTLTEYIQYCSGKSIQEQVDLLQSKVSGMTISCVDSFGCFCITVSKA